MVYFFDKKNLKIVIEDHGPYACKVLVIEFDFGQAHQGDGHSPWHGDYARDYAMAVVNSVDREALAKVFEENSIKTIRIQLHGIKVTETYNKDQFGLPLKNMKITFNIVPQDDIYKNLAEQVIESVHWKVAKAAITNVGKYFWYDPFKDIAKTE